MRQKRNGELAHLLKTIRAISNHNSSFLSKQAKKKLLLSIISINKNYIKQQFSDIVFFSLYMALRNPLLFHAEMKSIEWIIYHLFQPKLTRLREEKIHHYHRNQQTSAYNSTRDFWKVHGWMEFRRCCCAATIITKKSIFESKSDGEMCFNCIKVRRALPTSKLTIEAFSIDISSDYWNFDGFCSGKRRLLLQKWFLNGNAMKKY